MESINLDLDCLLKVHKVDVGFSCSVYSILYKKLDQIIFAIIKTNNWVQILLAYDFIDIYIPFY